MRVIHLRKTVVVGAVALAAVAAGCGSSSKSTSSGSGGSSSGAGKTFTVGVLTDETGPAASGNKTAPQGVDAGTFYAKTQGYTIKYVVADTETSPAQALVAAKTLVEQDHVFAVIAHSSLAFAAAPWLTQQNVPVIGVDEDANEWASSKNMFSVTGVSNSALVTTLAGEFFKMEGATNVGVLGYSISPSSSESAKGAAVSAQLAGLKAGYVNGAFPFGSTNVAPIALDMKQAGIDGFYASVDPNTGFNLVSALRNQGINLKVASLPTGYGGDLTQAGAGALQEAQNIFFSTSTEPMEMNTAATKQFAVYLKDAGINGDPTYAEYNGYTSVVLLVQGLKAAGSSPTQASLISALSNVTSFDAGGLYGSHPININLRTTDSDLCTYYTKLVGTTFQLVSGADPLCGTVVPGKTVSASS